ncbi:MAG: tripartite tricarboxylate transporter TctB family protein [Burkholderiales bacterium]|nr:tripartite tricarboxylate transporter TctB family protein [Burkholderiales bacterium]
MTRDGIAGLICLALSLCLLVLTRGLPKSSFVPIGPDFYPRIVLAIMALLSVILIATDLWKKRARSAKPSAEAVADSEKRNYRLVGITFAVFAAYVVLLPFAGYRIATFIFMAALQAVFEMPRSARRWIIVLTSALVTAAITYLVFQHYLSVLLPRGSWTNW